jgi:MFS family permease
VDAEAQPLSPAVRVTIWLALIATAAIAIYGTTPPRVRDETAAPDQFSAARAKRHVEQIAREPHPIGTAANHRVRDYLIEQLTALGAEVELQRTVGITDSRRQIYAGNAQNIFAVIKGNASSRAVMLASHYDSVPEGPGAADAASGVASILETVRALRATGPLKNDVMVLFTDGEEEGLIGAAGFVRDHPEIVARVGIVLNLEARGSSGPALMFETSDENGWLTREFARVAPYPFSSSLAYAVYKRLPNQTDMTVFKMAGLPGLNFAFNATFENYHTRRDTPENLDLRSVQNLGANALALARHFGNLELRETRAPERIYFNWFGSNLIDYPQSAAWVILAVTIGLLVALLVIGFRGGQLTPRRTSVAIGGLVLVVVPAAAGANAAFWLITMATEDLLVGDTLSNSLLAIGCLTTGLAFALAVQSWLASGLRAFNSAAGQLIALAVLTVVLTALLPTASYVLRWPLLFAAAGMLIALLTRWRTLPALAASLPALLIFAPLMYLLFVTLGFETISVSVLAVLLGLLVAFMAPLLPRMSGRPRVFVAVLLVVAAVFSVAGIQLTRFSPAHPGRHSLVYAVNADEGRAAWISYDDAPDVWTRQFLTASPARGKAPAFTVGSARATLSAAADLLPVEAPTATVSSDRVADDTRTITLRLTAPRNANALLMRLPAELKILSVRIDGHAHAIRDAGAAEAPWLLRFNAPPPEGVELELHLASAAPFSCWLGDRSYGLPELPGRKYEARPTDLMPTYGSDVTLVTRSYRF